MSPGHAPIVEQSPLAPVRFDGIHADAHQEMSRLADEQMKSVTPDLLSPRDRIVFAIEESDVALLMKNEKSGEHNRDRAQSQND